ncbi:hypothetical protein LTR78_006893 [Recurvomyces mirabilis]|uniref:Uncharacterized protein n=1 Tax=Recurvomyces mirabilis TaxID=574656 RepID=A0AAE0WKF0_9PEZI|nr:hypothetical protein LTR78_006893 [Recurvomyces mirabilis]KAK5153116.1 hypothetical protein LTS14_007760 [Recurvomyces mirabilis]
MDNSKVAEINNDSTSTGHIEKTQPWKAYWPAPREPQSQANLFGFKKGETMVFDGNAGNFFARDKWEVEQESASEK